MPETICFGPVKAVHDHFKKDGRRRMCAEEWAQRNGIDVRDGEFSYLKTKNLL